MMLRMTLITISLMTIQPVYGAKITGGVFHSTDSDAAEQFESYAEIATGSKAANVYGQAGYRIFSEAGADISFNTFRIGGHYDVTPSVALDGQIGYYTNSDWSPVLGQASVVYSPTAKWRFEASAERGVVDSIGAINSKLTFDTLGFGVDYAVTDEWTVAGSAGVQDYDDAVNKTILTGRIIYSPRMVEGLHVQYKYKTIDSDVPAGYTPPYFSPKTDVRQMVSVGYARTFANDNWVARGWIGAGNRKVDADSFPMAEAGIKLIGRLGDASRLEVRYECTKEFGSSDYKYCQGLVTVGVTF